MGEFVLGEVERLERVQALERAPRALVRQCRPRKRGWPMRPCRVGVAFGRRVRLLEHAVAQAARA